MVYDDLLDEASQTARLVSFEAPRLVDSVAPGLVCVVATVERIEEQWWRISQLPSSKREAPRQAVVASQHIALLTHSAQEWAMLAMLGVTRRGEELECWPGNTSRAAHLRARLVLPGALAQALNLRIAWEFMP